MHARNISRISRHAYCQGARCCRHTLSILFALGLYCGAMCVKTRWYQKESPDQTLGTYISACMHARPIMLIYTHTSLRIACRRGASLGPAVLVGRYNGGSKLLVWLTYSARNSIKHVWCMQKCMQQHAKTVLAQIGEEMREIGRLGVELLGSKWKKLEILTPFLIKLFRVFQRCWRTAAASIALPILQSFIWHQPQRSRTSGSGDIVSQSDARQNFWVYCIFDMRVL